ncbi:MAG: DUF1329 domain-containing protein [Deltaproteobacteria bacterium]|nr:DUF1329 domain-containing protein [Deltaproteobacteria bacterium]
MRNRIIEWSLAIVLAVAWTGTPVAAEDVAASLKVGDTLDTGNAQLAKDLLPPEILKHYEKGDYKNKIVSYPLGQAKWEKSFLEATEKNAGQLDVDERGTIVEKGSNKQSAYYYGIPFPVIDEKDPKAGVKIAWNQFLAYWYGGSSFNRTLVSMLSRKGIDREIVANGWFNFLDGLPPKYRQPNPNNLQSQFLGVSLKPADLQGTSSLTWRYREPDKRDSVWAFIPALRRVRAVSPANRSDGYLGSDISGDDGFFFDGKPEDFEWKLIGKHDALRIVDPNTVTGPIPIPPVPGGGWVVLTDLNPPTYGAAQPGWTGAPWAPTDAALAKRPMYIIQAIPRDKYYLYGRIELWIDAETWDGAWNRKFSWGGELVHEYQMQARVNHAAGDPNDPEYIPTSTMVWACAENFKMDRATLGGLRADPHSPAHRRVPIDAALFESTSLQKYGK